MSSTRIHWILMQRRFISMPTSGRPLILMCMWTIRKSEESFSPILTPCSSCSLSMSFRVVIQVQPILANLWLTMSEHINQKEVCMNKSELLSGLQEEYQQWEALLDQIGE